MRREQSRFWDKLNAINVMTTKDVLVSSSGSICTDLNWTVFDVELVMLTFRGQT